MASRHWPTTCDVFAEGGRGRGRAGGRTHGGGKPEEQIKQHSPPPPQKKTHAYITCTFIHTCIPTYTYTGIYTYCTQIPKYLADWRHSFNSSALTYFQEVKKVKKTVSFNLEPEIETYETDSTTRTKHVKRTVRRVVRVRRVRQSSHFEQLTQYIF